MVVSSHASIRRRWLDALCTNLPNFQKHFCRRTTHVSHSGRRLLASSTRLTSPTIQPLNRFSTRPLTSFSSSASAASSHTSPPVDSLEDVLSDTLINWYPGHMHKTFQALDTQLQHCHVVVEVRDARVTK